MKSMKRLLLTLSASMVLTGCNFGGSSASASQPASEPAQSSVVSSEPAISSETKQKIDLFAEPKAQKEPLSYETVLKFYKQIMGTVQPQAAQQIKDLTVDQFKQMISGGDQLALQTIEGIMANNYIPVQFADDAYAVFANIYAKIMTKMQAGPMADPMSAILEIITEDETLGQLLAVLGEFPADGIFMTINAAIDEKLIPWDMITGSGSSGVGRDSVLNSQDLPDEVKTIIDKAQRETREAEQAYQKAMIDMEVKAVEGALKKSLPIFRLIQRILGSFGDDVEGAKALIKDAVTAYGEYMAGMQEFYQKIAQGDQTASPEEAIKDALPLIIKEARAMALLYHALQFDNEEVSKFIQLFVEAYDEAYNLSKSMVDTGSTPMEYSDGISAYIKRIANSVSGNAFNAVFHLAANFIDSYSDDEITALVNQGIQGQPIDIGGIVAKADAAYAKLSAEEKNGVSEVAKAFGFNMDNFLSGLKTAANKGMEELGKFFAEFFAGVGAEIKSIFGSVYNGETNYPYIVYDYNQTYLVGATPTVSDLGLKVRVRQSDGSYNQDDDKEIPASSIKITQGFDTSSVGQRLVKYVVTLNGQTLSYQLRYKVISKEALSFGVAQIQGNGNWFGHDYKRGEGFFTFNTDRYALQRFKAVDMEGMSEEDFEIRSQLFIYSNPRFADDHGKVQYDYTKSDVVGYIRPSDIESDKVEAYKDASGFYHIYSFSFQSDEDAQRELDELRAQQQAEEGGEEGLEEE